MDMRRLNARNYAVYLQRRAEDFVDPERPLPKWSELDREAVRELLREFQRLDRAYDLAAASLQDNGLPIPLPLDEEAGDEFSAWMVGPQPSVPFAPPKRRWWQIWRRDTT
jgi:hypothetical protein